MNFEIKYSILDTQSAITKSFNSMKMIKKPSIYLKTVNKVINDYKGQRKGILLMTPIMMFWCPFHLIANPMFAIYHTVKIHQLERDRTSLILVNVRKIQRSWRLYIKRKKAAMLILNTLKNYYYRPMGPYYKKMKAKYGSVMLL